MLRTPIDSYNAQRSIYIAHRRVPKIYRLSRTYLTLIMYYGT